MNKKVLIIVGVIAGFGLLGYGLFQWYRTQIDKVMQYCYKIKRYKIIQFDMNKILMTIDVLIRNKSAFDMDINGYDMSVYINDVKIAVLKDTLTQKVNNNSLSLITLNVDVIAKNLFTDLKKLGQLIVWSAMDKSKVIIKVQGNVSASSSFIKIKDLPINISMSLQEILTDDPNAEVCSVV